MSGRIRSLKPEWLDDQALYESSDAARVLSAALILLADDHGNGRAGEMWLSARVFPGRPIKHLREAMKRLVAIRYCSLYESDGQAYFSIRNWAKHQKVDKPGKRKVPPSPENIREGLDNLPESEAKGGEDLAPRAIPSPPIPSDPDPEGSAEGNQPEPLPPEPDRETVCPMDLPDRADKHGIPEQFAKTYRVPTEAVRYHVRETLTYWTIGGGAGRRKKNWMQTLRTRLHELGKAGGLLIPETERRATDLAERKRKAAEAERAAGDAKRRENAEFAAKVGAK